MIWESEPWKLYITGRIKSLQRRRFQRRWSGTSFAALEQDIFFSAYAVRKLVEAYKISDEVEAECIWALSHLPSSGDVDVMNWHRIEEHYDLATSTEVGLTLRQYCNQIIHSFIFIVTFAEDELLDGFFVASDFEKKHRLLYFTIEDIVKLLDKVAEDDIVSLEVRRDQIGGLAKIIRKSKYHKSDN